MIDIKLNAAHDIVIEGGDLQLVSDGAEVAQSIKIRILTIQGEWEFDFTLGLPWFNELFAPITGIDQKKAILRNAIIETTGVAGITDFVLGLDPIAHVAELTFDADTIYGSQSVRVRT